MIASSLWGVLSWLLFLTTLVTAQMDPTSCLSVNGCELIVGGGTDSGTDMIGQWGVLFNMQRANINDQYNQIGYEALEYIRYPCHPPADFKPDDPLSQDDLNALCYHNHSYVYDYAVLDFDPKELSDVDEDNDDIMVTPIYMMGVVLAHKVAGFSSTNPLRLSRDLVYKIFSLQITRWNDPQIVNFNLQYNPTARFPNATITVIARSDDTGLNRLLNKFMISVNGTWQGIMEAKPHEDGHFAEDIDGYLDYPLPGRPNVVLKKGAFATTNAVLQRPNTIGYLPMNYALNAGLSWASIQNKAGFFVDPDNDGLQTALLTADAVVDEDGDPWDDTADIEGAGSYPLALTNYVIMLKETQGDCGTRARAFKFFKWCLTAPLAIAHTAITPGFTSLATSVADEIVARMGAGECQQVSVLAVTYADTKMPPLHVITIVFSLLFIICLILIFALLVWRRDHPMVKATGLVFAGTFFLGCFFNYIATIVYSFTPINNHICNARWVLVILGTSVMSFALFTKSWCIYNYSKHVAKKDASQFEEIPSRQLAAYISILGGFQLLVIILWVTTSPQRATTQIIDVIDIVALHVCHFESSIWVYLQAVYLGVFLIWGGYLAMENVHFWSKLLLPNESQTILNSMINGLFWSLIFVPLESLLRENADVTYFFIIIAIYMPTSFSIFSIFVPKIFYLFDANSYNNAFVSFLAGNENPNEYRPPVAAETADDTTPGNQTPVKALPPLMEERNSSAPSSGEEKEAKKDSPLVWYRQISLDNSVIQSEGGRESTSEMGLPDTSGRIVASSSIEMMTITEE